ncbi:hypothetical protein MMC26_004470 [Xylographa opegraphella]|nr:hypothetical protein [Xylographa opegraphella]
MGSSDLQSADNDFVNSFPKTDDDGSMNELAICTLGCALLRIENDYGTHYNDMANASNVKSGASKALCSLLPQIFEWNINAKLSSQQIPLLNALSKDKQLFEAFRKQITDGSLSQSLGTQDALGGSANYKANIIFVYEYLRTGQCPKIIPELSHAGSENFMAILKHWLEQTDAPSEGKTFSTLITELSTVSSNNQDPFSTLSNRQKFAEDLLDLVLSVQAVYAPNARLDVPALDVVKNVITNAHPQFSDFAATHFGFLNFNFVPVAHDLWLDWDTQVLNLRNDIQNLLNSPEVQTGYLHKIKTYAKPVYDLIWYAKHDDLFNLGRLSSVKTEDLPTIFSCFKAGTLVWTDAGQLPIEMLGEGDSILTRAEPKQYGVRSDENVATPIPEEKAILIGINGESAFFTPGHVFYTTTGLRAVDPEVARRENPWLTVGELKLGHVLLRSTDGVNYTRVPIERMTPSLVDCKCVYGVHLREGLCSYHANGYLVHLNYPEITMRSIASALKTFSTEQPMRFLQQFAELQPIFARFGVGTVADVLSRELYDDQRLRLMRPRISNEQPPMPLRYQTRSFELFQLGDSTTKDPEVFDIRLPTVDAFDGVLLIDGNYCERAHFTDRGLIWSRPIDDHMWEHAMFMFQNDFQLLSGKGVIWYGEGPTSAEPSVNLRQVEISSVAVRSAHAAAFTGMEDLSAAADATAAGAAAAPEEPGDAIESMEESKIELITSPPLAQMSTGAITSSTDSQIHDKPMLAKVPQPRSDQDTATTFQRVYAATYDSAEYNPKSHVSLDPSPFLDLACYSVGGINDIKIITFTMPALDELASKRHDQVTNGTGSGSDLKPFTYYETEAFLNEKNNLTVKMTIQNPQLLAMAADQYSETDPKRISYQSLTFKNAGSNLELPFVFSQGYFSLDATEKRASGMLRDYDPTKQGTLGKRHNFDLQAYGDLPENVRKVIAIGVPGYLKPGIAHQQPISSPFEGQQRQPLSCAELINLPIDSQKVKGDAQNMLYRTMVYHMDDNDRKNFLGIDKEHIPAVGDDPDQPQQVPTAMAGALDQKLKTWLRKTYVPAYVAINLARLPKDHQDKFHINYHSKDLKKLEYFWKGRGKNAMAQQDEYNDLNRMSTRLSLMRRVPRLQDYLDDTTTLASDDAVLKKNSDWAKYKGASATTVATYSGKNALEHHTNILHTLFPQPKIDPNKELSLDARYTAIVEGKLATDATTSAEYVGDLREIRSAVTDNLRTIIEMVLKGQDEFEPKLKAQIEKDLKAIAAYELGISEGQIANSHQISDIVLAKCASSIAASADAMTSNFSMKLLAKAFKPGVEPTKLGAWASSLCVLMTVVSTVTYALQAWQSWKQIADWVDVVQLVFNSLQAVTGLVYGILAAKNIWQDSKLASESRRLGTAEIEMTLQHQLRPQVAPPGVEAESVEALNARNRQNVEAVEALSESSVSSNSSMNVSASSGKQSSLESLLVHEEEEADLLGWEEKKAVSKSKPNKADAAREELEAKWNVTQKWIRGVAAIFGAVLLVMACFALAHNWKHLDGWEQAFNVVILVHQAVALVIDVVLIFTSVAMWVTVVLAIVGLILMIAYALYEAFKERPKTPIQEWYESTGRKFVDDLHDPPEPQFDWKISPESGSIGSDITIVLTGTAKVTISNGLNNLSKIAVSFAAAKDSDSGLSNTEDTFSEKEASAAQLNTNQVSISVPSDLNDKCSWPLLAPDIFGDVFTWRCVINANKPTIKSDGTKMKQQLIELDKNKEVKFEMRGKIARKGSGTAGDIFKISVVETYLDAMMEFLEVIEPEIYFKKI